MLALDYDCSISKHIEATNGTDIMMLARELKRKTTALARYKKHLTFNHTLKRENILPPSLKFTPPIRSKAGYKIARNTDLKNLRLRITQCHQSIGNLQTKIQEPSAKPWRPPFSWGYARSPKCCEANIWDNFRKVSWNAREKNQRPNKQRDATIDRGWPGEIGHPNGIWLLLRLRPARKD